MIMQASQSGLLEKATERANADSWHAALSVKHWGGKVHSSQRWQQLQMLQHFSRRALRCVVMTAHLLQLEQQQQQQQHDQPSSELRDEEDKFIVSDQIDQLGVMLRDAAMCLGPWYEPYAHRPDKSTARPLLLRAAEVSSEGVGPSRRQLLTCRVHADSIMQLNILVIVIALPSASQNAAILGHAVYVLMYPLQALSCLPCSPVSAEPSSCRSLENGSSHMFLVKQLPRSRHLAGRQKPCDTMH